MTRTEAHEARRRRENAATGELSLLEASPIVRPYGDTTGDGMVQVSFTLPLPHDKRAEGAAMKLAIAMGIDRPLLVHAKAIGPKFTFFVIYGPVTHLVDIRGIELVEREYELLSSKEVNTLIKKRLRRKLVVVGACIGTDAHTVGIDAILNIKGFAGEKGLEYYREMAVHNLGAQVLIPDLVESARALKADAVLVNKLKSLPNVDIIVNGGVALSNVPFGAISDYLSVPGGSYNVKVSPAGAADSGPYVIDADVALTAGTDYTVIASGFLADIYPAVLVDDNSAPAAGSSRVRFFHGSPDAPAVDIALVDGPVLIAGAPFGANATITVPAGTYDLEVRVAGTTTEVLQLRGLALADGVVYTAYASGLVADGSADRTLYLGDDDRFRIDATFTDFAGNSGVAKIFHTTSQTGQFWFFSPENIELLIKVIDGRDVNNAFWLFHGSASNVQYTVTVTDTVDDVQKTYSNPLGNFGSDGDIEAFPQ